MCVVKAAQGQHSGRSAAKPLTCGSSCAGHKGQAEVVPWKIISSIWEWWVNPTAQIMLDLSLRVPGVQVSRHREMKTNFMWRQSLSTSDVGHAEIAHFTLTPSRWIHSLFYLSRNHLLMVLLTVTQTKFSFLQTRSANYLFLMFPVLKVLALEIRFSPG